MAKTKLENRSHLAQNVVLKRNKLDWPQEKLAEKADLHVNIIKKIELGKGEGSPESRQKIASALKCTVSDLYRDPNLIENTASDLAFGDGKAIAERLTNIEALIKAGQGPKPMNKQDATMEILGAQEPQLRGWLGAHIPFLKGLQRVSEVDPELFEAIQNMVEPFLEKPKEPKNKAKTLKNS